MSFDKKYYIKTYGCQMNEHDSEKIAGMLEEMGYSSTDELEEADLIFLNTCTIRENAELKVFGKVGSLKRLKRKMDDLNIYHTALFMAVLSYTVTALFNISVVPVAPVFWAILGLNIAISKMED